MSYVAEFLAGESHDAPRWGMRLRKKFRCADGFEVSIQASAGHYCYPRENEGPWDEVELGFPTAEPTSEIMQYAETPSDPTRTIYGYVPVDLVDALIDAHGGPAVTPCQLPVGPDELFVCIAPSGVITATLESKKVSTLYEQDFGGSVVRYVRADQ